MEVYEIRDGFATIMSTIQGVYSITSTDAHVVIDEGVYTREGRVVTVTMRVHGSADSGTRYYFANLPAPASPVFILPGSYNTGKTANAAWYYFATDGKLSNTGAVYAGEPHCLSFSYITAS